MILVCFMSAGFMKSCEASVFLQVSRRCDARGGI